MDKSLTKKSLTELAERFAELKGTEVLSSRFVPASEALSHPPEEYLSFVLGSGQKLHMTEKEFRDEIARLEPKPMRTKPIPDKKEALVAERKTKAEIASTKAN